LLKPIVNSHAKDLLELEIQALLQLHGSADLAADALAKKYSKRKLQLDEFEVISAFFLNCGFWASLVSFILKKLEDKALIPWGHFCEALFSSSPLIEPEIKQAIIDGAEEAKALSHLCKSHSMDHFDERLRQLRQQHLQSLIEKDDFRKQELLQNLEIVQSQGLRDAEGKVLEQLQKHFADDPIVHELVRQYQNRLAKDVIAQQPNSSKKQKKEVELDFHISKDSETQTLLDQIEASMKQKLKKNPQLCPDFALAQLQFDNQDAAFRLLNLVPANSEIDWLKAEALLKGRRLVELMEHLTYMESSYSIDPDTTFAVNYFRAQALWGLAQKQEALDIMEKLVAARPHYRAAHALLDEWKEYV
jgi:hypothetical protein